MTPRTGTQTRVDRLGAALVIAAAIAFSAKGIFVKLAYGDLNVPARVDPVTLLTLRMALALPMFGLIAWWSSQKSTYSLTRRDWLSIGAIGLVGYYGASLLDFWGLMYISVSLERLILFLNPTFVVFISAMVIGYRITSRDVLALVISYSGIALVFINDLNDFDAKRDAVLLGGTLVLLSAILYAIYLVAAGQMIKRIGAVRFAAYASIISTIAIGLHFILTHDTFLLSRLSMQIWKMSAGMALISTVLPIVMMAEGMRRIGSSNAAMMSSIGPVATIFMGYVFLGEAITAIQICGAALVMAGVLVISLKKS